MVVNQQRDRENGLEQIAGGQELGLVKSCRVPVDETGVSSSMGSASQRTESWLEQW